MDQRFTSLLDTLPPLPRLLHDLKKARLFLVGGAVRDVLLKRETKDYDFVVTGVPPKRLQSWLEKHGDVDLVGKAFGVFKFRPKKRPDIILDIALPRTEHSWGLHGGYREFDVQSDPDLPIEKDLERRDFTINAMAVSLSEGEIVDPFGGQNDLRRSLIRSVGDARARFLEDHTRVLRGIRFACQLAFKIEGATWNAIIDRMAGVADPVIPRETIGKECVKAFAADPVRAFDLFDTSRGFAYLMPELLEMRGCPQPEAFHTEGDVWTHTRMSLTVLGSPAFRKWFPDGAYSPDVLFGVLFHDIGKPRTLQMPKTHGTDRIRFNNHDVLGADMADAILRRLRLSASGMIDQDHVVWLVRNHLVITRANISAMKPTTVEKYFLHDRHSGLDLMKVIFADTSATIGAGGSVFLDHLRAAQERVDEIIERGFAAAGTPSHILTGSEIMETFHVASGPRVGIMLEQVREAQLSGLVSTKEEAFALLHHLHGT